MYRRRRPPPAEVTFNFDSFLDLVANLCGIIIRLILVAWVGARAYHASMENTRQTPPDDAPLKAADDPLSRELLLARAELEKTRLRLLEQLKDIEKVQSKTQHVTLELASLTSKREQEELVGRALLEAEGDKSPSVSPPASPPAGPPLALADLKKHQEELLRQIKELDQMPLKNKVLRFRTPLSKPVATDELMFECRGGRVTFIDLPAFLLEIEHQVRDLQDQLERRGRAVAVTSSIGAFRLNYGVQRQGYLASVLFHRWVLEPITDNRGETFEQALKSGSSFRQALEGALPDHTVVTFWVYPDSFGLFRQLRDVLYHNGMEVAGRPLPTGVPIMGSSDGTASRGQ
ncbi:MAG: hypothetical protein FJ271_09750 [Planctomycetes bacterium]|nr:hypothetical protein [Planctomycetota bacterium]